MEKISLICLPIMLLIEIVSSQTTFETRFVLSLIRDGAYSSSKLDSSNLDLLKETWTFPNELTEAGMRMHYLLGASFRRNYNNFLSTSYSPKEVYVKSAEYNKTMSSVNSFLHGLFPAGTGATLNSYQKSVGFPLVSPTWKYDTNQNAAINQGLQVFPVNAFSEFERGNFFLYNLSKCEQLNSTIYTNQSIYNFQDKFKNFKADVGAKIVAALSLSNEYFDNIESAKSFFETFISDYNNGKQIKVLTDQKIDLNALNQTAHDYLFYYNYNFSNQNQNDGTPSWLSKIVLNSYMTDLLGWMSLRIRTDSLDSKTTNTYRTLPKIAVLGVNNLAMASSWAYFKNALNLTQNITSIPYASSLSLVLKLQSGSSSVSGYSVDVIFNDKVVGNLRYSDFNSKIQSYVTDIDSIDDFCFNRSALVGYLFRKATIGLGVLFVFFFLLFVITLIVCCCCYEKKGKVSD